jgi:hypothetical protein
MTHPELFNDDALDLPTAARPGASLIQRLVAWYGRKANAERDAEIAAFINDRGGQFTDEMEREISRRFGGMAG